MNIALQRLRELRAGHGRPIPSCRAEWLIPRCGDAAITPADLPADWRVEWEERAAIREYDGGQAREHAEAEALGEVIERMREAGHDLKNLNI